MNPATVFHRRGRAGVVIAAALLALAALLLIGDASPASAQQSETILVSNLDETTGGTTSISSSSAYAQSFTAGSAATLGAVRVPISATSGTTPRVSIYSDSSGALGTSLQVLTNPDSIGTTTSNKDFTSDGSLNLTAGATYWVYLERTAGSISFPATASTNQTGTTDWTIGDKISYVDGGTATPLAGQVLKMAIVLGESATTVSIAVSDLVSNLAETTSPDSLGVRGTVTASAQPFTAGSNVRLGTVRLGMAARSGVTPRVSIYSDSSGDPGTSLHVLTNPDSVDDDIATTEDFTSASFDLTAGTTYWVVVEKASGTGVTYHVNVASTRSSSQTGESDWTIGDAGYTRASGSWSEYELNSEKYNIKMAILPRNSTATGSFAVSGVLEPALKVYADSSGVTDSNGLDDFEAATSTTYEWVRVDGGNETVISGETGRHYTVQDADEGKRLKVNVTLTDDHGFEETVTGTPAVVNSATTYLVDNLGETKAGDNLIHASATKLGQPFTTSATAGTLRRVHLRIASDADANILVSIYSDSSNVPGSSLHALISPATIDASKENLKEFTSTGFALSASTTYWLVVEQVTSTDEANVAHTASNSEASGISWTIGSDTYALVVGNWLAGSADVTLFGLTQQTAGRRPVFADNYRDLQRE